MRYSVYMLLCNDNSFYTGITNNITRRLYEHESGLHPNSYTAKRLPVQLVYQCPFSDINLAIAFEKRLKAWSRAKKVALIEGNFNSLPELSKKKFKRKLS